MSDERQIKSVALEGEELRLANSMDNFSEFVREKLREENAARSDARKYRQKLQQLREEEENLKQQVEQVE